MVLHHMLYQNTAAVPRMLMDGFQIVLKSVDLAGARPLCIARAGGGPNAAGGKRTGGPSEGWFISYC